MKNITRFVILMLLIAAVIIPTTATASGFSDDKVVFGGNFTLGSGEVLNGDLVVFGGNIVLETSSTINGDTVVLGGNVTSDGTINGNLVAMGGIVEFLDQAQVNGDLIVLGSSYEQAEGAVISGNIITEENIPFEFNFPDRIALLDGKFPAYQFQQLPLASASWFLFRILIWTGLAILMTLFVQDQAAAINRAAFGQPFISFVVGLGVILIAPLVILALIITILLSPVSLLGIFALIAAWVVGLVALSLEIGRKLAAALNQSWPAPLMAGLGMLILSLFFNGFSQIVPCFGWMPKFVLGLWVMGAVILTRFGTREYPETDTIEHVDPVPTQLPPAFAPEEKPEPVEVNATKAARELAETEGLELDKIKGTGAEGKITLNDVRKALKDQ
jgi:pyruvate/2-oxoglutarate dehydrogenase complex dihydrolipoamide acyltransferase (E2) component